MNSAAIATNFLGQFLDEHGRCHRHGCGLEARVRDLSHGELLVVRLLCGDNRQVAREHGVNPRVRHQVDLELRDVKVQGVIDLEQLRVALRRHGCGLEARVRDLSHGELLMVRLLCGDNRQWLVSMK